MNIVRLCLMLVLALPVLCRAQAPLPVSGEISLDARSRVAAVGGSATALYQSSLRLQIAPVNGWSGHFYLTHKYTRDALQEGYVERQFGATRAQLGVVRMPFGIYDLRETYASGLIDYPMPRGNYLYNSLDWGVPGASASGGTAKLQWEGAAFGGKATGIWDNQNRLGGASGRLQTYSGDLIVGYSRWQGYLYPSLRGGGSQPVHMNGVDVRYTRPHLLLRGEGFHGTLAGDHNWGGYMDAYYHLPGVAPWTLTARVESYHPGDDYAFERQVTLGARYVATKDWTLVANWRTNNPGSAGSTWTPYAGKHGDLFFQAYHKLEF